MQTRLFSGCAAVVAAVAFLAGSPRAQADTVTLYFDHTTNQTTHPTFNGSAIPYVNAGWATSHVVTANSTAVDRFGFQLRTTAAASNV